MKTKTSRHRAVTIALATVTMLTLSGCASGVPVSVPSAESATATTKEAGGFLRRDLNVCFENTSSAAVTIKWRSNVNTNSGSGTLKVGHSFCGEGRVPEADVTFADSFGTNIVTGNPNIGRPGVYFKSVTGHVFELCEEICHDEMQFDTYASASYSEGESVGSDVEGHHFSVTRKADDDWINFVITILD